MEDHATGRAAPAVLMVRPAAFGFNEDTAATNLYQNRPVETAPGALAENAVREFDSLAAAIRSSGVEVIVIEDRREPQTPDAVFPNNWISCHADGTVVLYPMCAPSRRMERRDDLIPMLRSDYGFRVARVVDLTHYERGRRFLEGTGSIVFDHLGHCAYANLSARTHREPLGEIAAVLGYEPVVFHATDRAGNAVYHTNIVMSIGTDFAVVALEAIRDSNERAAVGERLEATGRRMIRISLDQMERFAGNVLEVSDRNGRHILVMSTAARAAYDSEQVAMLEASVDIVAVPLPTIETVSGGSARCMLVEVFLPRRLGGSGG